MCGTVRQDFQMPGRYFDTAVKLFNLTYEWTDIYLSEGVHMLL